LYQYVFKPKIKDAIIYSKTQPLHPQNKNVEYGIRNANLLYFGETWIYYICWIGKLKIHCN